MTRPLAAALGAILALAPATRAQDTPPDERLPSLTPRVFESRGTARVSLPDIARQPLTGFGPPPRTYVVPAERAPTTRPFQPDLDALTAFQLAPPEAPPIDLPAAAHLRVEGGAGTEASRYARVDIETTGASGVFYADVDYDGADGRLPTEFVQSDRLDLGVGGRSYGPGRLHLDARYAVATYSLPGAAGAARRQRQVGRAGGGIESVGPTAFGVDAAYTLSRLGRTDDTEPETTEGRVDGTAWLRVAGDRLQLDAGGGASVGDSGPDARARYAAGGAAVRFGTAAGVHGALGLRALTYDVSDAAGGGSALVGGPIVDLRAPLSPTVQIFAQNDPHVQVRSLGSLAEVNPFVVPNALVVPDLFPVDARVGVEIGGEGLRTRGYLLGTLATVQTVFERSSSGLYLVDPVRARTLGLGGDVSLLMPGGLSATAGIEIREGSVDGGDQIPFLAPLVGRAGVQVPFAGARGRVGLGLHAESTRPTRRVGGVDAPAWGLLSADAHYVVTGPLAVTLRGEHLVGTVERWPGFPEIPYQVMLGLRLAR